MSFRWNIVEEIIRQMRDPVDGVPTKDRTFHFHVYCNCFVGQEFVIWLINHHYVESKADAMMFGQYLVDHNIIYHVSNDQPFRDGYFFYTFQHFPALQDEQVNDLLARMKAPNTGLSIQDRTLHFRT
eukprot:TRINITY_DN3780_c0_g1_i1.p1 TRINITY_DN3780_c0_g1~~TRINITY_DN3780_c0_g1_i1.p1  ORF type:complete len:127 (-),score=9.76 TRINITY_DN3780_c0_g1_i1:83-463(-)